MNYFESVFDIVYLVSVLLISVVIIRKGVKEQSTPIMIFGIMGFLLGFGDSFHLVPRIIAHLTTGLEDYQTALGIGKLITGITMTVFYYLIYQYYVLTGNHKNQKVHIVIISLIVIRFILLALPGNDWYHNGSDLLYGILRNVPFAILGGLIVYLFLKEDSTEYHTQFHKMGIWIIVSFVCYTITILGSSTYPILGAFMLPKTVAYFIIIMIGYRYNKQESSTIKVRYIK